MSIEYYMHMHMADGRRWYDIWQCNEFFLLKRTTSAKMNLHAFMRNMNNLNDWLIKPLTQLDFSIANIGKISKVFSNFTCYNHWATEKIPTILHFAVHVSIYCQSVTKIRIGSHQHYIKVHISESEKHAQLQEVHPWPCEDAGIPMYACAVKLQQNNNKMLLLKTTCRPIH